jgi:hypothetical protein
MPKEIRLLTINLPLQSERATVAPEKPAQKG